jgi:hypothetical protein
MNSRPKHRGSPRSHAARGIRRISSDLDVPQTPCLGISHTRVVHAWHIPSAASTAPRRSRRAKAIRRQCLRALLPTQPDAATKLPSHIHCRAPGSRGTVVPSGSVIGPPVASISTRLARNASAFAAIRSSSSRVAASPEIVRRPPPLKGGDVAGKLPATAKPVSSRSRVSGQGSYCY